MKAVPKVNRDGLYLEDTIVDDTFYGVVPFYAPLPESEPRLPPESNIKADDEQPEEEAEPEIAGYTVGVSVPPGLYLPRFDLLAWELIDGDLSDPSEFWEEGLTVEEIEELTKPQPQEPDPMDILGEEVSDLKLQLFGQQQAIVSMDESLEQTKQGGIELQQITTAVGSELIKQDLTSLDLKQQNNVIGAELIKKDISILDLYMQNQVLGKMLASLELRLLAMGTGGESNV
ncbi:hypothetical protein [Paenibacillus lutimineralis]|uniref:hypothetical protein n=1 Tax=Paenibacillus lutimineralis TaxID=2707005 RepID=UPI0018746748|nr:hypothetical protein [Paenibacillus lutimineralis]